MDDLLVEALFCYVGIQLQDTRVVGLDSVAHRTIEIHDVKHIPLDACLGAMYLADAKEAPAGDHQTSYVLGKDGAIFLSVNVKYDVEKNPKYVTVSYKDRRIQSLPFQEFFDGLEVLHTALGTIEKDLEQLARTGNDTHGLGRVWSVWEPELKEKYKIGERTTRKHEHRRSE